MNRSGNPSAPMAPQSKPPVAGTAQETLEVEPMPDLTHFFKGEDWWAALFAFVLSTALFWHHMAPEVTLQDSGELVTGAFSFGVPHPPGYPLWAFLGYIWSHFIVPFGNPAWRIGLMSVFTGGLVVCVMTLMMTRSIRILLHSLPWSDHADESVLHWIALTVGVSVSLLFGFNRGVWLWACVSEMRVLNVFSFVLISCAFFAWMMEPRRRGFLYATLLIFGLSVTNHQTVTVMAGALVVGTLAEGVDRFFYLKRTRSVSGRPSNFNLLMDCLSTFFELTVAVLFSGTAALLVFAWLDPASTGIFQKPDGVKAMVLCGAGIVLLLIGRLKTWVNPRQAFIYTALFLSGCAFYAYMPIAASTNPPMNWGYASTKEGFLHSITRGQYEKMQMASLFSAEFLLKIKVFVLGVIHQYSLPLCLFGLVSIPVLLFVWRRFKPRGRSWLIFVWTAFFVTSFGLLTIINPKLDKQEQEITIKFFAPAHGFYAMLIGYGLAFTLSLLLWRAKRMPRIWVRAICVALLALPLISYKRNWALCALGTHDFGYQFGYRMFYPGGGYAPMEKDAILYGGTDPGRFVPTYLIFCESRVKPKDRFRDHTFDRSDVYIITQNALADNTYMSYIRDHYDFSRPTPANAATIAKFLPWQQEVFKLGWKLLGRDEMYPKEPIFIPSQEDSNRAFQQYVTDVQAGRIQAGADVQFENGRVSVQGVQGVMAINGILAKWIFDKNKDKHAFYVEESYVIPWMYPYLRPHGVIMKLEKDPLPSPQENPDLWAGIVSQDRSYWDALTAEFLAREDFRRNSDAQKSFSKMRSALAGLYLSRGMQQEAEYAFKQAMALCIESPEACFRLADLYMQQRRFGEAEEIIAQYAKVDPYNSSVTGFLSGIKETIKMDARRQELEKEFDGHGGEFNAALELAAIYQRLNMSSQFSSLTMNILNSANLPAEAYLQIGQMCAGVQRFDFVIESFQRYLSREPGNFRVWVDLAVAQVAVKRWDAAIKSLKQAMEVGGVSASDFIRNDARFGAFRQTPEFQKLFPSSQPVNIPKVFPF